MTCSAFRFAILAVAVALCSCGLGISANRADSLVEQLKDLPPGLGPPIRSDSTLMAEELSRSRIYTQLFFLGDVGVHALGRGLHNDDVGVRRNAALALSALGTGYYLWGSIRLPRRDISPALRDIEAAIGDEDDRVKALAIHAIFYMGASAGPIVPRLIDMLGSEQDDMKAIVCFALRGIGPAAVDALPALRMILSDPDERVRNQARMALEAIETHR